MDQYEISVMHFLTANRETLIAPQYHLRSEINGTVWESCPDFIAYQPRHKNCFLIEVSASADIRKLSKKVGNEENWTKSIEILRQQLSFLQDANQFCSLVFIREELITKFQNLIKHAESRIRIFPLEITQAPWKWKDDLWYECDFLNLKPEECLKQY
jgi:hypothetical protein